ncbi:uncharacterized protein LOC143567543 [Bidens hawaiensis]|uniref:uncharacterized protein LOC143567543 n=1 Tax=Bidens hawaiensis TaxID=980011 RepID=UPI004049D00C
MTFPDDDSISSAKNLLLSEELAYDRQVLNEEFGNLFSLLTGEQRLIYEEIITEVCNKKGGVFFVYGYGGTGKTFLWKTLSAFLSLRYEGNVVLSVASNSDLARLLHETSLIIWDEAPMVHKHGFEALDRSLKYIFQSELPFGGTVIVFGGDFQQILPVLVEKRQRNLQYGFLDIGEGNIGGHNTCEAIIDIPEDLLIKDSDDPISDLIDFVYPCILDNFNKQNFFHERAILAPKNDVVQEINDRLLSMFSGDQREYLSSDSICLKEMINQNLDESLCSPDILNGIKASGLPNHKLILKVGVLVMLLRNIDKKSGMCNGTRLKVVSLGNHVIQIEIISRSHIGDRHYIPRIT